MFGGGKSIRESWQRLNLPRHWHQDLARLQTACLRSVHRHSISTTLCAGKAMVKTSTPTSAKSALVGDPGCSTADAPVCRAFLLRMELWRDTIPAVPYI